MNLKKAGFSTRAIHAGEKDNEFGAVTAPIYQTAPFEFKSAAHAARVMGGKEKKGYWDIRVQRLWRFILM